MAASGHAGVQFLLGVALVVLACSAIVTGCGTMRHALYDERALSWTNSDGVARAYTELTPKASVTDAISGAGSLLGPYGTAGAALTLSLVSLVAHGLNARSRKAALKGVALAASAAKGKDG